MRLQVKILWVGAPTQNISAAGTFYNQDIVAQSLDTNDSFVLRVTSGSRANNISDFHILKDEVMEVNGYFNTSFGKENRPFMQFNCTAIQRDRSLWGTTGGGNSQLDFSKMPQSYAGYRQVQPAQQAAPAIPTPPPAPAPQAPANPFGAQQSGVPF